MEQLWNCALNTSQSVKICRAKKKHLAKGYAKVAGVHLFLTFDFARVSQVITISSLIELRVGKTLLSLFLIVY